MKFKRIISLSCLILISATKIFSQTPNDTIAYKVKDYEVKKQQKVVELAQQLKVDPTIILQLNHLRSVERVLVTGIHIKIPVYPKANKSEEKANKKPAEPNLDSIAKAAPAKLQKERKENLEQTKEKLRQDSVRVAQQKLAQETRKNYDPEIDNNNLMLVDATLELNEAMLAGIRASLDTLSKPDPEIKNKNDVKEILQRMKRARDRTELKPYLEYMNDSLSLDCNKLRTQKEDILSRLTPYLEHQRTKDSVTTAELNKPITAKNSSATTAKTVKKNDKKHADNTVIIIKDTTTTKSVEASVKSSPKQKSAKSDIKSDTVIVVEIGKSAAMKPAKEKHTKANTVTSKADTIQNTISDSITHTQIAEHKKGSWDTARAVIDSATVTKQKEKTKTKTTADSSNISKEQQKASAKNKTDSASLAKKSIQKTTVNVSKRDSIANRIASDEIETKIKQDTIKKTEIKASAIKKDTLASAPKPVTSKTNATADNNSSSDSVQHIKSQFLLKRAQKAIAEKKTKQAEDYLAKSLELWKDNYDAWMTLADQDALAGSQAKALKEYQECARIDSSKPKLFYSIASLYATGKKKTEAVQYFSKTVSLDSGYILAYMGRASIYSDWKKYDEAINDYDKVLDLNKSYHYAYKARGMVKQLNKRFSEAVDDFTRYLIFEETDPSAYYYRGLAKIGNNELLEGCLDLSKSAEMGYDAAEKAIKKSCE